ncbi:MAG TPA: two-component regulator propeller domain-containing protein, partial [Ignavibacteriaceae bacterium]|nr:two-component regulator propeller domain-containing protein [Ignavibacteriaceae bacterium]
MKNLFSSAVLILIMGLSSLSAQQLNLTFEHFKLDEGMVPNVPTVFQDRTGYLWFGSYFGIFRYDGYTFKRFLHRKGGTSSPTNAIIEAICDDSEGNIWIGHNQGIDKFDPTTEIFTHYTLNPKMLLNDRSNHVLAVREDRKGNLWVGTGNGLYLYNKKNETFKRIIHDSTDTGSLIQNTVNAIYESRDGTVWFGTGNGLDRFDKASNKFVHYWSDPNFKGYYWTPNPHWILSVFEDRDGIMWLGTSGGLVAFHRNNNLFNLYKNDPSDSNSLFNNVVASICEDSKGDLWLSAEGLNIFNKRTKRFSHYTHNELDPGSLSNNNISEILLDRSGTIWITTLGSGVNKYILPNQYLKQYSTEKYGNIFSLVEDNNGKIWIPTAKGLVSFDPEKEVFKEELFKIGTSGVLLDETGTLWISSWTTGYLFYKKVNEEKINQFFESNGKAFYQAVSAMCDSKDGIIWLGTSDGKILKINVDKNEVEQIAKYDYGISAIYQDYKDLIWIGTTEAGLICYNPQQKTFERFSFDPKDSMTISGNQIMDFSVDGTGTLWIVANNTLNKFDKAKQKFIR